MNSTLSITCTCTHGGGGHAERCPMFVPRPEDYAALRTEHARLRNALEAALKKRVPNLPGGSSGHGWELAEDVRRALDRR